MKWKKLTVFTCVVSLLSAGFLVGCGKEKNALMDMRLTSNASRAGDASQSRTADYLSKDLCVIPKNKQTKRKDAAMTAKASMIINDTDGKMLYSNNIYQKLYPASITKIVTTYVALKYGKMDDVVTVSYNASHITEYGATLCGLQQGDRIVLWDLLNAFMVHSGNDAGIAIAEHIAGSEKKFAKLMNKEMAAVGAVHSHFANSHGLHSDKHYTTAYDLYLIFRRLIQNDNFIQLIDQGHYTLKFQGGNGKKKKISFLSTDRYLIGRAVAPKGVHVIGGKTGTTFNAGSCLILYSVGPDQKKYISVVLKADGGDDLYRQMNHLMAMEGR
jgi:D-alanyl-D-alanine carboxypeptidase